MSKNRLDLLLLARGLATTRTKAQELISGGFVKVDGKIVQKSGEKIVSSSTVIVTKDEHPFVSRGGVKLAAALSQFSISVEGKTVLDIGISTGGFSDCVLREGAKKVFGVDVGHGQLAEVLRMNSKLTLLESTHIKDLVFDQIGEAVDIALVDLSFISLQKVIPYLRSFLHEQSELVLLVKPQFELAKKNLNAKGIVTKEGDRRAAIEGVQQCLTRHGYQVRGQMVSPISGGDGNVESFLHAVLHSPKT